MKRIAMLLLLGSVPLIGAAIDREVAFDDPALQARYETLTRELRCLVCQNQAIADSNATLAADLRREVRAMIADGASDAEIKEFMVARYGDFVLYRPPFKRSTWLLWLAPALLVIGGLGLGATIIARKARLPVDDGDAGGSDG